MNNFLAIENRSFYNHLMHKQLNFKMHIFLFISILKHVDRDEIIDHQIFLYITHFIGGHNYLVMP